MPYSQPVKGDRNSWKVMLDWWSGLDKEQPPPIQEQAGSPRTKQMSPFICAVLKPSKSRAGLLLHTQQPKPGSSCAASALLLPSAGFRMIFGGQEIRAAAKGSLLAQDGHSLLWPQGKQLIFQIMSLNSNKKPSPKIWINKVKLICVDPEWGFLRKFGKTRISKICL